MSIKYNERGEVIAVNGIVTGHHIGTPMQDATPEKPEDNEPYGVIKRVETNCDNSVELWEEQPSPMGGVSSWNDLTDKPFGVKTEMVEILPEESVKNGTTIEYWEGLPQIQFTAGRNYIVEFDGKKYPVVGKSGADNGVTSPYGDNGNYLGNPALTNESYPQTDEPFFIFDSAYGGECIHIEVTKDDVLHTIAIYKEQEVVEPIDPKFLPFTNAEPDVVFTTRDGVSNLGSFNVQNLTASNGIVKAIEKIIAGGSVTAEIVNAWIYGDVTMTEIYKLTRIKYSVDFVNFSFMYIDTDMNRLKEASVICNLDGTISQANITVVTLAS